MSKREPLSQDAFDKLLLWLDKDREKAGQKYESIRFRIIRILASKGCCEAEDLADETINVVIQKIDWLLENYEGDPILYFLGVAKKIYQEYLKRRPLPKDPPQPPDRSEIEQRCAYLDECLQKLTPSDRELVLQYHQEDKKKKIIKRKQLATARGISLNALRIKIFHLHATLRMCMKARLQQE